MSWAGIRPRRVRPSEPRLERDGKGEPLVAVLVPRFYIGWVRALAQRLGFGDVRINLDGPGSCVWRLCDGTHTVAEIGEALLAEFGERIAPIEERLPEFLRRMKRQGLVTWDTEARAEQERE